DGFDDRGVVGHGAVEELSGERVVPETGVDLRIDVDGHPHEFRIVAGTGDGEMELSIRGPGGGCLGASGIGLRQLSALDALAIGARVSGRAFFTNVPPPRPRRRSTTPRRSSRSRAARTLERETCRSAASVRSPGSSVPSGRAPTAMPERMWSAICCGALVRLTTSPRPENSWLTPVVSSLTGPPAVFIV